jgi:hypothetical protein
MMESRSPLTEPSTAGSSTLNIDRDFLPSTGGAWQQNVSASFSQLSLQFQAASQAVATVPQASDQALSGLNDRLDSIENGQRRLAHEIELLKEQFALVQQREPGTDPIVVPTPQANESTVKLEAALKEQLETFKLVYVILPKSLLFR